MDEDEPKPKAAKRNPKSVPPKSNLNGVSPDQRSDEKIARVLGWVYLHGFSTAEMIRQISRQAKRGYAKKLVTAGLLVATRTESGGIVRSAPDFYFTLSERGLQEAQRHSHVHLKYPELDRWRVDQRKMRHNLIVQEVTWFHVDLALIAGYLTERMIHPEGDQSNVKRPDAVWIEDDDSKTAIEVELTGKWDRDLDEFILKIIRSLNVKSVRDGSYDRYFIVSDSQAILDRYKKAVQPGSALGIWAKSARNHWEKHRSGLVPDWLVNHVHFHLYPSFIWKVNSNLPR